MLIRSFERWMSERGLTIELGEPYYTATLYLRGQRVLGVEAPTLAELVAEAVRAADVAQRQEGVRWALEPNQLALTFEEVDARLRDDGRFLSIRVAPGGYDAYTTDWSGGGTTRAGSRPTLEGAILAALSEMPIPEIERTGMSQEPAPVRPAVLTEAVVLAALERTEGNVSAAARDLNVPRTTLRMAMQRYGLGYPEPPPRELLRAAARPSSGPGRTPVVTEGGRLKSNMGIRGIVTGQNTKDSERRIRSVALAKFGEGKHGVHDVFYEQGQWFVSVGEPPTYYSAVDDYPGFAGSQVDFEEV